MKYLKVDAYDGMCFFGGLVFFAPLALLVRTQAGISEGQFFLLQVLLSAVIALGELPTGYLTDRIGYCSSLILSQLLLLTARGTLLAAYLFRSLPLFVLEAVIEGISACPPAQAAPISMQPTGRAIIFQKQHMRQISAQQAFCSVRQATL